MNLAADIDLVFFLAFAAGFYAGGLIMIRLITRTWHREEFASHEPAIFALLTGAVAGTDLAALIGRTPLGPLIMGVIVGCLAMVRARLT